MSASRQVAVIGGGISGLATAALLARDGHRVDLYEAAETVGGRAGSWEEAGFRFDTGPSWYLMPEVFDHFFALMGTSAARELDLVDLDPAYRVFSEGHEAFDVRSGREAAAALFESLEPGSGPAILEYLSSAQDAYDLAVGRFLYDPYTSLQGLRDPELLRRLPQLAPLLTGTLAGHVDQRFTDQRLRHVLGYPAVFLGGSPYAVPSLYHLMSHLDLGDRVSYPLGGMTTIIAAIERLARGAGVRIHTRSEVTRIESAGTQVTGLRVRQRRRGEPLGAHTDGEHFVAAETIISTGDLHATETRLLPPHLRSRSEKWWDARTPSPGARLPTPGVRGHLGELGHHSLLFRSDWREGFEAIFDPEQSGPDSVPHPASLYVCRPSATDPSVAPAGHENLFVLVPVPADTSIGRGGDEAVEQLADEVVSQISEWCGIPDLAERIVVRRTVAPGDFAADLGAWRGNALGLSHTLAQSAVFRPRNESSRAKGLYFAGADVLPGIGMPMCLISAELVLKRIRGDKSAGPLPSEASSPVVAAATSDRAG